MTSKTTRFFSPVARLPGSRGGRSQHPRVLAPRHRHPLGLHHQDQRPEQQDPGLPPSRPDEGGDRLGAAGQTFEPGPASGRLQGHHEVPGQDW